MDVALHASDQVVVDLHQHAIAQLSILFRARMQLNFAVKSSNLLDFSRDEVALDIVVSDVELVFLNATALYTAGQVDRRQVKNGVLVGIHVYLPARLVN